MRLPTHQRYDFSSIVERTTYAWPDDRKLAFYVATNIEMYAFREGMGDDFSVHGAPQTQRNYSWRDYGNRVGSGACSISWMTSSCQPRTT